MIWFKGISKSYGEVKALKDVCFHIKQGEIFGLLGPNGAGKSTTVNILSTLLKPDRGEVLIDGLESDRHREKCKLLMGVVPQEIALYDALSAYENLLFWGGLYNMPVQSLRKRIDDTLHMVGLYDRKNDKIKTYSGGMKRRINIACAILHNPKILLMDEPAAGVDPQNRNHLLEFIEKLNAEGMTIIYTTHYMEEAERLCHAIAIMDNGKIIIKGTLNELKQSSGVMDLLIVRLHKPGIASLHELKSNIPFLRTDSSPDTLKIECAHIGKEISYLLTHIQHAGGVIESIESQKANLESIFLKLTGKKLRE